MLLSPKQIEQGRVYTVYLHTNKLNGKRYVGITKQKPERRWQNGHGYVGTYFGNAVSKYGWDAFEHEILFEGLTKEAACDMECFLIIRYGSANRDRGYNTSHGGETADVITVKNGAENPRAVAVRRINPKDGTIVVFETMQEAADRTGVNRKGVGKACKGQTQTYKGYVWEYADKEYKKPPAVGVGKYEHIKQRKAVKLINESGQELRFKSVQEAAQFLGVKPTTISRYIVGARKDPKGRIWEFDR